MSTSEVAEYIGGMSAPTLRKLTKAGDLPAFKVGRTPRYRRCDADAYLASCRLSAGDLEHLIPRRNERAAT